MKPTSMNFENTVMPPSNMPSTATVVKSEEHSSFESRVFHPRVGYIILI